MSGQGVRTGSPVSRNPNIYGGQPVFAGTRVPVRRLFEYLETGHDLDAFLLDFPTVEHTQAEQTLVLIREKLPEILG